MFNLNIHLPHHFFDNVDRTNTINVLRLDEETISRWENEVFICIEISFETLRFGQGFWDYEIVGFRNVMDVV